MELENRLQELEKNLKAERDKNKQLAEETEKLSKGKLIKFTL